MEDETSWTAWHRRSSSRKRYCMFGSRAYQTPRPWEYSTQSGMAGCSAPTEALLRPANCPPFYHLHLRTPLRTPDRPLLYQQLFALPFMSHTHPMASSSSNQSSNFQLIINNALDAYKKRTKNDLLAHPLASQLQRIDSPSAILAVLQQQLQGLDQSRRSDERWTRWLDPTVNVLCTLSGTLGEGVGLVRFRS